MAINEYSGSAAALSWTPGSGTAITNLAPDFRKVTITPSVAFLKTTAGSDAREGRIAGVKDGKASFQIVAQAGGTALLSALAEGVQGTLIYGSEGTATNKPKTTLSGLSGGLVKSASFDDIVIYDVEIMGDGQTYTEGAY